MASGDTVYNLFVSDRQVEEALRFLTDLFAEGRVSEDILFCPECGSADVHPAVDENDEDDAYFPLEPRFRLLQKSGDPIHLKCKSCGHDWS